MDIGTLAAPVINLTQAVGIGASYGKLDPSNYSLAEAYFQPGEIVNNTLVSDPNWELFFSRIYEGFWLYGDVGQFPESVSVDVDALSAIASNLYKNLTALPTSGETFHLNINSTQALSEVRSTANISGIPSALIENGSLVSLEPRIVLFGPSSNNEFFLNPLNSSLSGQKRLCWIVSLTSPVPQFGYQGEFAVDAETGKIDSAGAQNLFPDTPIYTVEDSLNFSSAKGLEVSNEKFGINGSLIGASGTVFIDVQNVLILKPGSSGTIELNFSSTMKSAENISLLFTNPFPSLERLSTDSLPKGVSANFSDHSLLVPADSDSATTIDFSATREAQIGTFVLEIESSTGFYYFIISVWNGVGQWPPPPPLVN